MQYNRLSKLEDLNKGLTFDSRRHSRDNESDADSPALVYFRNSGFDPAGAVSAMLLLDDIDADDTDMTARLRSLFNAPQLPSRTAGSAAITAPSAATPGSSATARSRTPLKRTPTARCAPIS